MRKWNSAGRSLSLGAGFGLLPSKTDLVLTSFYFSYFTVMCMGQVPECRDLEDRGCLRKRRQIPLDLGLQEVVNYSTRVPELNSGWSSERAVHALSH